MSEPMLEAWQREIEALSGGRLIVLSVESDPVRNTLSIPPLFPGRPVVAGLLSQESFVRQLVRAHALTVNYDGADGRFHFVLRNGALRSEWADMETELLAHEYGHVWLEALGYRSPAFDSCVAAHAGDIVQHPLLIEEMRRRGFSVRFWVRNFGLWLDRAPLADPSGCDNAQVAAMLVDARLSFREEDWPQLPDLLAKFEKHYPVANAAAGRLVAFLKETNLRDRSLYEHALARVLEELGRM